MVEQLVEKTFYQKTKLHFSMHSCYNFEYKYLLILKANLFVTDHKLYFLLNLFTDSI